MSLFEINFSALLIFKCYGRIKRKKYDNDNDRCFVQTKNSPNRKRNAIRVNDMKMIASAKYSNPIRYILT